MLKLKFISLFFTVLMLIQVLPVQQIGNALSQNQWTEELPHNCESGIDDQSTKAFLPAFDYHHAYDAVTFAANAYIHFSEQVPSNHSTDVVSPPPDVLA